MPVNISAREDSSGNAVNRLVPSGSDIRMQDDAICSLSVQILQSINQMADSMALSVLLPEETVFDVLHDCMQNIWQVMAYGLDGLQILKDEYGFVHEIRFLWHFSMPEQHDRECIWKTIQQVQEIAADARQASGIVSEQCKYVHDALCRNILYAGNQPDATEAYDALCCHQAICSGISKAYIAIMRYMGIPAIMLTSDSMDHQWCMLRLGSSWYHADITYDLASSNGGRISYDNFLKSDSSMRATGHHDWRFKSMLSDSRYQQTPMAENDYHS